MEMLTLKDSTGLVFVITDLLRGVRYSVADRGSHYEIDVPTEAGYIRVEACEGVDVIDVADRLVSLLDNGENTCFTLRPVFEPASAS